RAGRARSGVATVPDRASRDGSIQLWPAPATRSLARSATRRQCWPSSSGVGAAWSPVAQCRGRSPQASDAAASCDHEDLSHLRLDSAVPIYERSCDPCHSAAPPSRWLHRPPPLELSAVDPLASLEHSYGCPLGPPGKN